MGNLIKLLQKMENLTLIIAFIVMICASFAQVVNRNITRISVSWFEELARYCMIYMALLATEVGLRDGSQISITIITDKLHGFSAKLLDVISRIVVIVFSAACFFSSFSITKSQIASNQISSGLHLPMVIPYFALQLSFGIIMISQTIMLIGKYYNNSKKEVR